MTRADYEARCAAATHGQGLEPIIAHLTAAGIRVVSEQTGGYCMVATVYGPDHASRLGITIAESHIAYCETCDAYFTPADEVCDCGPYAGTHQRCTPNPFCDCACHVHGAPTYLVCDYPFPDSDGDYVTLSATADEVVTLARIWLAEREPDPAVAYIDADYCVGDNAHDLRPVAGTQFLQCAVCPWLQHPAINPTYNADGSPWEVRS